MRLKKLVSGRYLFIADSGSVEANLSTIRLCMLGREGISPDEQDFALSEMERNNHDVAVFGIMGKFTHTCSSHLEKLVIVELQAIKSLREEFHTEHRKDPESIATREAANRLQSLYITLNVEEALELLGTQQRKLAA